MYHILCKILIKTNLEKKFTYPTLSLRYRLPQWKRKYHMRSEFQIGLQFVQLRKKFGTYIPNVIRQSQVPNATHCAMIHFHK